MNSDSNIPGGPAGGMDVPDSGAPKPDERARELLEEGSALAGRSSGEILEWSLNVFEKSSIVFSSSMGAEDQVLTHLLAQRDPSIPVITLDTGRLFQETYDLIAQTNTRYGINIEVLFPERERVEQMVHERGINLFYESIENRKLCCGIRKLEPLARRLDGLSAWITGLRREQSITRSTLAPVEWDSNYALIKINPLADWTTEDVWDFIRENRVPYNKLHDEGFPSIGCEPCTRPVKPGEDVRAGRWWWEQPEHRECGLHERRQRMQNAAERKRKRGD